MQTLYSYLSGIAHFKRALQKAHDTQAMFDVTQDFMNSYFVDNRNHHSWCVSLYRVFCGNVMHMPCNNKAILELEKKYPHLSIDLSKYKTL